MLKLCSCSWTLSLAGHYQLLPVAMDQKWGLVSSRWHWALLAGFDYQTEWKNKLDHLIFKDFQSTYSGWIHVTPAHTTVDHRDVQSRHVVNSFEPPAKTILLFAEHNKHSKQFGMYRDICHICTYYGYTLNLHIVYVFYVQWQTISISIKYHWDSTCLFGVCQVGSTHCHSPSFLYNRQHRSWSQLMMVSPSYRFVRRNKLLSYHSVCHSLQTFTNHKKDSRQPLW